MSRRLVAAVVGALVVPLLTGCGASGTGDKGYVTGDGVISQVGVAKRHTVGEVSGSTLDNGHFNLSDHRGKVVVVNVWGSWCGECRAEAKALATAANELVPKGVVFIGINTRDASRDNGLAYDRSFEISYPSIFDPSGRTLLAFRGTITPNSIPSTIVIDAKGGIAASVLGTLPSATTLVDLVQDAGGPAA